MELPPRRDARRPLAQINVTPLVDVMLVLLILFLVTASLGQEGISVALPQAKGSTNPESALTVTINAQGRLSLDSAPVEASRLTMVLADRLRAKSSKMVLLKADESIPYGLFVRVVSQIKAAGVDQLGMVTQPLQE